MCGLELFQLFLIISKLCMLYCASPFENNSCIFYELAFFTSVNFAIEPNACLSIAYIFLIFKCLLEHNQI